MAAKKPAKKPPAPEAGPAIAAPPSSEGEGLPPLNWVNVQVRLGDLVEWENNPRKLTSAQAEALRSSMKKFGYVEPIVVGFDRTSLIGGHQRKRILVQRLLYDFDTMLDARAPTRPLTPKEREEIAIRLNLNQGEWDLDMLANQFDAGELIAWGFEPKQFDMDDSAGKPAEEANNPDVCPKCKRPL